MHASIPSSPICRLSCFRPTVRCSGDLVMSPAAAAELSWSPSFCHTEPRNFFSSAFFPSLCWRSPNFARRSFCLRTSIIGAGINCFIISGGNRCAGLSAWFPICVDLGSGGGAFAFSLEYIPRSFDNNSPFRIYSNANQQRLCGGELGFQPRRCCRC